MNYEIKYELTGKAKRISMRKKWLQYIGCGAIFVVLCMTVIWSAGGDWAVTVNALESMSVNLQQGSGLLDAFSSFCLDVLRGTVSG